MSNSPALYVAIEKLLNRQFSDNPPAEKALAALHGETLALEFEGTGLKAYLTAAEDGLRLDSEFGPEPAAIISGSPLALLGMARTQSEGVSAVRRSGVSIHGDPGVAQGFQKLLGHLQPDWEEELSRLIGDGAAHRMGNAVRSFFNWGRDAGERASTDMASFLTRDSGDLPTPDEAEVFFQDVDTLRDDVERAAARLEAFLQNQRGADA